MPKASKAKTVRASPVAEAPVAKTPKVTASVSEPRVKKPRKSSFINSTNHRLPTVVVSPQELQNLAALQTRDTNRQAVDINCLFTRQNKFGGWEFQLTDGVYESLMDVIMETMEFDAEAGNCCITKDDYTGHWRLRGKLSKAYTSRYTDTTSIPVPKENSIVHLVGGLETSKMKGKDICYFQIDSISQVIAGDAPASTIEEVSEDEE